MSYCLVFVALLRLSLNEDAATQLAALQKQADLVMLRKARCGPFTLSWTSPSHARRTQSLNEPSQMKRSRQKISNTLATRIRRQARYRCGYCLNSETLLGMPMEIEHIIPLAAGGTDAEENLWLSCRRCNGFKGIQTHATDEITGQQTALFNPRTQVWQEHFQWSEDGTELIGLPSNSER